METYGPFGNNMNHTPGLISMVVDDDMAKTGKGANWNYGTT